MIVAVPPRRRKPTRMGVPSGACRIALRRTFSTAGRKRFPVPKDGRGLVVGRLEPTSTVLRLHRQVVNQSLDQLVEPDRFVDAGLGVGVLRRRLEQLFDRRGEAVCFLLDPIQGCRPVTARPGKPDRELESCER